MYTEQVLSQTIFFLSLLSVALHFFYLELFVTLLMLKNGLGEEYCKFFDGSTSK